MGLPACLPACLPCAGDWNCQPVAIKVLTHAKSTSAVIEREAGLQRTFRHRNVVAALHLLHKARLVRGLMRLRAHYLHLAHPSAAYTPCTPPHLILFYFYFY